MKKTLFILLTMSSIFSARAESLIKNGDFDKTDRKECRIPESVRKSG